MRFCYTIFSMCACQTRIHHVKMWANPCTKLSIYELYLLQCVTVCLVHFALSGSATFLSRNQLSRHSMPSPPSPLWMISCLTLSPSPFVLFHWPCMFQKQISFSSTGRPPIPPPLQPLHHQSPALPPFQIQALSWVPVQVYHLTPQLLHLKHPSLPHHPTSTLPTMSSMLEFGGVCQWGVHQSWAPWWYKTLRMHALIRSFCQISTPELKGATLLGEGGGQRVKTAENNKEIEERG